MAKKKRRQKVKAQKARLLVIAASWAAGFFAIWFAVKPAPGQKPEEGISSLPDDRFAPAEFQAFLKREIPEVIAQVNCHCGCNQTLDKCYRGHCPLTCKVCNESGKIAYEMHRKGKSIEEIQGAVDRKFARF